MKKIEIAPGLTATLTHLNKNPHKLRLKLNLEGQNRPLLQTDVPAESQNQDIRKIIADYLNDITIQSAHALVNITNGHNHWVEEKHKNGLTCYTFQLSPKIRAKLYQTNRYAQYTLDIKGPLSRILIRTRIVANPCNTSLVQAEANSRANLYLTQVAKTCRTALLAVKANPPAFR